MSIWTNLLIAVVIATAIFTFIKAMDKERCSVCGAEKIDWDTKKSYCPNGCREVRR